MESLKNFFKRRSWPSKPSKPKFHQDSQGKGSEFINHGLGLGNSACRNMPQKAIFWRVQTMLHALEIKADALPLLSWLC
jgi:hypothetical protein